jgi:hypothetical protein
MREDDSRTVVTRTNQGSARYVMRVPRMETTSAATRAQTDVDLTADTRLI